MITPQPTSSIFEHFESITDPRVDRRKKHRLEDIFFMTLSAVICGADNWVAVETFCKLQEKWLANELQLENRIPSHDTFGKVFSMINVQDFSDCFTSWMHDISSLSDGEIVAIDGKTLRGAKTSDKSAIHMVSAWACHNQCVLGQQVVDQKSNEITAVPKLLEKLNLTGVTVTTDAMGCQRKLSQQIIAQDGEYLFCLKGNQGTLHDDVSLWFESHCKKQLHKHCTFDGDHGRIEQRKMVASSNIEWLQQRHDWPGLKSIIAMTSTREVKDKKKTAIRV